MRLRGSPPLAPCPQRYTILVAPLLRAYRAAARSPAGGGRRHGSNRPNHHSNIR